MMVFKFDMPEIKKHPKQETDFNNKLGFMTPKKD
jgi:hypothetical protein